MSAVSPAPTSGGHPRKVWRARLLDLVFGLVLCLSVAVTCSAAPIVPLPDGDAAADLASFTELLADSGHTLRLNDVLSAPHAQAFAAGSPRIGLTAATYWLRYRLNNPGVKTATVWFDTGNRRLQELEFYAVHADGEVVHLSASASLPFAARPLPTNDFVFPLELPSGSAVTVLLRVRSFDAQGIYVQPALWTPTAYQAHAQGEKLQWAIYLGIALTLAVINLSLYLFLRERSYLLYVLSVLAMTLTVSCTRGGYGAIVELLLPEHPRLFIMLGGVSAALGAFFASLFLIELTDLRTGHPRIVRGWWRLSIPSLAGYALVGPLQTLASPGLVTTLQRLIVPISVGMLAALGCVAIGLMSSARAGQRSARIALIAWAPLVLWVGIMYAATIAGLRTLPAIFMWVSSFEMLVMSLALADRYRTAQLERVRAQMSTARLRRFFSPQLAEIIVAEGEAALQTHRREVTVVFIDLRGFTMFTDHAEPEDVIEMLRQFHAAMGQLVLEYHGTLERFAGDSIMIFFNDPVELPEHSQHAVKMAQAMQAAFAPIAAHWQTRGHQLGLGCGISTGFATLGEIGFEGRWDYAAIGGVTNRAARLCAEAKAGEVLVDAAVRERLPAETHITDMGALTLKGFSQPVVAFSIPGSPAA